MCQRILHPFYIFERNHGEYIIIFEDEDTSTEKRACEFL